MIYKPRAILILSIFPVLHILFVLKLYAQRLNLTVQWRGFFLNQSCTLRALSVKIRKCEHFQTPLIAHIHIHLQVNGSICNFFLHAPCTFITSHPRFHFHSSTPPLWWFCEFPSQSRSNCTFAAAHCCKTLSRFMLRVLRSGSVLGICTFPFSTVQCNYSESSKTFEFTGAMC